jgi:oxalate decarboxylase/phosphoglucose isomerase-like protein (cupin superfamily)
MRVGGDEIEFKVSGDQGGPLVAAEVRMAPGGGPPALHRHEPAELYRVERGELVFYLGDADGGVRRSVAGAGETVPIAGWREHTIRNESDAEAAAFVVYSPGAPMEAFAREAAALAEAGPAPIERVLELAAGHGIEITRSLEDLS